MKAIYQGQLCVVLEAYGEFVRLELPNGDHVLADYSDPALNVDPTDDDVDEATDEVAP